MEEVPRESESEPVCKEYWEQRAAYDQRRAQTAEEELAGEGRMLIVWALLTVAAFGAMLCAAWGEVAYSDWRCGIPGFTCQTERAVKLDSLERK